MDGTREKLLPGSGFSGDEDRERRVLDHFLCPRQHLDEGRRISDYLIEVIGPLLQLKKPFLASLDAPPVKTLPDVVRQSFAILGKPVVISCAAFHQFNDIAVIGGGCYGEHGDVRELRAICSENLDQQLAVERGVEQYDMRHAEHHTYSQEFWRRCKLEMNLIGSHDQFADAFHQFLLSAEQDAEFVALRCHGEPSADGKHDSSAVMTGARAPDRTFWARRKEGIDGTRPQIDRGFR